MIKVAHTLKKEVVEKEVFSMPSFILTDKKGGYLSLGAGGNLSRYQGSVFMDDDMQPFKVIENISLVGVEPTHLVNEFYQVERLSGKARELFFLDERTLVYEVSHFDGEAQLVLDMRPLYSYDDDGRQYEIYSEGGALIVEYRQHNTRLYLAIKTRSDFKKVQHWKKQVYEYDLRRGSHPAELYVYDALRFRVRFNTMIVMSWSKSKEEAIRRAKHFTADSNTLKGMRKSYWERVAAMEERIPNQLVRMAYSCAKHSLDSLVHKIGDKEGVLAGLPWFHQFWTRDEAISLKGLMLMGRYNLVKDILMRELGNLNDEGLILNKYPAKEGDEASADGVGWTFTRLDEFISLLMRRGKLKEYFNEEEMHSVVSMLEHSSVNLIKFHTQKGLAVNRGLETWMDTSAGDDTRVGARIEIQALRLRIYLLMEKLLKLADNKEDHDMYYHLEHEFQKRVKRTFWNGESIADGIDHEVDSTIRPNAFIAGYLVPDLLTKNEWVSAVRTMMPKLWCAWGGLTTIDKEDPLFRANYSGEDNKSYHRGDSWFWVNNLTALFLNKTDKDLFHDFVHNILDASAEEILFSGFIGHAAELSGASALESHGCWAQAWSAATFIELVHQVYGLG